MLCRRFKSFALISFTNGVSGNCRVPKGGRYSRAYTSHPPPLSDLSRCTARSFRAHCPRTHACWLLSGVLSSVYRADSTATPAAWVCTLAVPVLANHDIDWIDGLRAWRCVRSSLSYGACSAHVSRVPAVTEAGFPTTDEFAASIAGCVLCGGTSTQARYEVILRVRVRIAGCTFRRYEFRRGRTGAAIASINSEPCTNYRRSTIPTASLKPAFWRLSGKIMLFIQTSAFYATAEEVSVT